MVEQTNVNDGTVEGMRHTELPIFSVQYHPEACPGPRDTGFLFDEFGKMLEVEEMTEGKKGKLMVIGSGPIVIGQAAEFDFSGSQACRSLREEGYETVLVNSNPATIQTDLEMADIVYIEPLNVETIAKIIEKEKVEGVLSGMGGQTALNLCSELAEKGYLDRLNCRLLRHAAAGHRPVRGPGAVQGDHDRHRRTDPAQQDLPHARGGQGGGQVHRRATRCSSVRHTPWAAPAAASPTTTRSSDRSSAAA